MLGLAFLIVALATLCLSRSPPRTATSVLSHHSHPAAARLHQQYPGLPVHQFPCRSGSGELTEQASKPNSQTCDYDSAEVGRYGRSPRNTTHVCPGHLYRHLPRLSSLSPLWCVITVVAATWQVLRRCPLACCVRHSVNRRNEIARVLVRSTTREVFDGP